MMKSKNTPEPKFWRIVTSMVLTTGLTFGLTQGASAQETPTLGFNTQIGSDA
jgi:hypothetical protein